MALLALTDLTLRFGGLTAVNNVSFEVRAGEILSLIGPNGAGKTSLFNVITGIYEPSDGKVLLNDAPLEDRLGIRIVLLILAIGICAAVALVLVLNIQTVWSAAVLKHYEYQRQFPWKRAILSLLELWPSLPWGTTILPLISGFSVGCFGAFSMWHSCRRAPDVVLRRGVARTFQNIRLCKQMTVFENVLLGYEGAWNRGLWSALLRLPSFYKRANVSGQRALELLRFVGLDSRFTMAAGGLPYGHQRRLEIARALATNPKLLLLDEPAAGMNPAEASSLMELIRKIREMGVTVVLIEHHMSVVMGISDRIVVLDYGNKIAEGTPEEIKNDPRVIEAYLGKAGEG